MHDTPTPTADNPQFGGFPIELGRDVIKEDPIWNTFDIFKQHSILRTDQMLAVVDVDLRKPTDFDDYFKDLKNQLTLHEGALHSRSELEVLEPKDFKDFIQSFETASDWIELSAALDAFIMLHKNMDPRVAEYLHQSPRTYSYQNATIILGLIEEAMIQEFKRIFNKEGKPHPIARDLRSLKPIESDGPPTKISYIS